MRIRFLLVISTLLITALACALPGGDFDSNQAKTIETSVAATLTAVGSTGAPTAAETPDPPADDTAEPPAAEPTAQPIEADLVVVYTHQGNPWVVVDDQAPRQLSQAGDTIDVLISDDANRVVFLRREQQQGDSPPVEIRAVNLDGSDEQVLMTPADFDALYPLEGFQHHDVSSIKFIPGSHQLLLNTRAIPQGPGLIKNNDLLRLNSDSGQLTELLPRGQGGDFYPSPDGERLVLVQPDNFSLANIDGSNRQPEVLTFEPIITYSEFQYYPRPIWLANGEAAGVVIPNSDILAEDLTGTAWRLPRDGSPAQQLLQVEGNVYFAQESGGSVLSPGFERVVSLQGEQGARELTLTAVQDGSEQSYDSGSIEWRGWSPDGGHFLYSKDQPNQIQLGTIGADPTPLAEGMDFHWLSPSDFLFLSGSQNNWGLRRGSISGSPVELATSDSQFTSFAVAQP